LRRLVASARRLADRRHRVVRLSLNDWILALHLLAATALVGAMTAFSIFIVAGWNDDRPSRVLSTFRLALPATAMVIAGTAGTIVFGVWLSISKDPYELWDGWVIVAIVLWVIGSATEQRSGVEYVKARTRARELLDGGDDGPSPELQALVRSARALTLHVVSTVAVLLVLIDMIWKPGA
jgi:uncharacterized membrane protein